MYAIELINLKGIKVYLYKEKTSLAVSSNLIPQCVFDNKPSASFFLKINNVNRNKVAYESLKIIEVKSEDIHYQPTVVYELVDDKKLYIKTDPETKDYGLDEGITGALTFTPDVAEIFASRMENKSGIGKLYTELVTKDLLQEENQPKKKKTAKKKDPVKTKATSTAAPKTKKKTTKAKKK